MSSLDIYDDTENLISSDEYSDEDELMNAAVSTHHNKKPENSERYYHRPTVHKKEKVKVHPRPPFKKKLCSKYKSRSLKWLNGRAKREKSKQYLLCLKRSETARLGTLKRHKEIDSADEWKDDKYSIDQSETIELEESDTEYSSPIKCDEKNKGDSAEVKEKIKERKIEKTRKELVEKSNELEIEKQKELNEKQKELVERQKELHERQKELVEREKRLVDRQTELDQRHKETLEKQKEKAEKPESLDEEQKESIEKPSAVELCPQERNTDIEIKKSQKRPRSVSPMSEKDEHDNVNEIKKPQPERRTSTQLYREINEMFPKYDEVVSNHVKHNSTTINAIDENMTRLMQDIETLNDILQAKETEWNRLLNLKRVKEEILGRLVRKKHLLYMQDRKFEDQKYNLQTLKELELYLSESQPSSKPVNIGLSTTHQIIESRASMKTEELQKERNNTNRLQNILISSNILQRAEACNNEFNPSKNSSTSLHHHLHASHDDKNAELQKYQYLEQKIKSKSGRQGPLVDVKSIVADFRQQNPIVFPRVGKRIKANDVNYNIRALSTSPNGIDANSAFMETYNGNGSNYSPTLEKLLSTSSRNNSLAHAKHHGAPSKQGFKFNTDSQKSYYHLQSDDGCNEISITPVNCINRYAQRMQNSKSGLLRTALDVNSHHNDYYDLTHKVIRDVRNNDSQLCQECKMNEARFVCAGCGNQWYCSRECQVNAWDKHSEICNE
ncbi:putative leucine-rich repeat-containing protein DDB_G0290503 [Eurosta solidaginis]|uniref:putative leucine-rich repeat-containing protein DDB_G0290503 n=1 Tax=Eurosta solidaginis TaxID=178769 RepID=UPI0035315FFB